MDDQQSNLVRYARGYRRVFQGFFALVSIFGLAGAVFGAVFWHQTDEQVMPYSSEVPSALSAEHPSILIQGAPEELLTNSRDAASLHITAQDTTSFTNELGRMDTESISHTRYAAADVLPPASGGVFMVKPLLTLHISPLHPDGEGRRPQAAGVRPGPASPGVSSASFSVKFSDKIIHRPLRVMMSA